MIKIQKIKQFQYNQYNQYNQYISKLKIMMETSSLTSAIAHQFSTGLVAC